MRNWRERRGQPMEWGPHGPRRRRYTGEELRAIRAANGVGRPFRDIVARGLAGETTDRDWSWLWGVAQVKQMYGKWRRPSGK